MFSRQVCARMCAWVLRISAGLLAASFAPQAVAEDGGDFGVALASGDTSIGVRYRYEFVDQEGIDEDANASTARLRFNYRTGDWLGWSAFGEFDHVFHVGLRDFNSGAGTSPGRTQYPVVADPSGSDLNQLYVEYSNSDDWRLRLGRQRILLDNQRFVGGVGWRQNEQTYDGLTYSFNATPSTSFSYSYVSRVRRIFGDGVPAGKDDVNHHLFNARVEINDSWTVVPYIYYLDYEDMARASNSSATTGVRATGSVGTREGRVALTAEIATQSDVANNPVSYDAFYWHVDAAWALSDELTIGLGYESLGADGGTGQSFRTPLATLHAFQGWADRFLIPQPGGVDDLQFRAVWKVGDWSVTGVYHDFAAETGGGDYGSEIDLSASRKLGERYGLLIKAAFFSGDAPGFPDTTKLWLQLTAAY